MLKCKHVDYSFRSAILGRMAALGMAAVAVASFASSAPAESLLERIKNGEAVRLGFTNEPPGAYSGENNKPLGVLNEMTLGVLKKMRANKIEPVVTEWGSLVLGLQAGRFDIITAGMWIKRERCRNVLFSEPIATERGALLVPKGNPEGLHSYEDVRDKGLTFVTGTGYTAVQDAKKSGIADDKIMQVAGPPEVGQAVAPPPVPSTTLQRLDLLRRTTALSWPIRSSRQPTILLSPSSSTSRLRSTRSMPYCRTILALTK
ncbi:transporter substrate-binding domain-containing protein [Mesorhizobium sp.]|uniref:transporter substrate-binding domain-containing protein n=2 Tax=Mesorhizobium sp. TaxID=1871066 RepID=UPI00257BA7F7|nr:transporter substrate-binding domain-containing protein [Mesorhizobium sp.]